MEVLRFMFQFPTSTLFLCRIQPDRPDELSRIQAAGGRVIYWDGARVLGVLAMSRAIGEFDYILFFKHGTTFVHLSEHFELILTLLMMYRR